MSFTAEVKDELSRLEDRDKSAQLAQLSALMRVCGTLSFRGSGRYSIRIATETGAVARTVIKMTHKLFDLDTALTVRRSVLHKTRNYLIEMPEQDELANALMATASSRRITYNCGRACASSWATARSPPSCAAPSWLAASSRTHAGTSTWRSP